MYKLYKKHKERYENGILFMQSDYLLMGKPVGTGADDPIDAVQWEVLEFDSQMRGPLMTTMSLEEIGCAVVGFYEMIWFGSLDECRKILDEEIDENWVCESCKAKKEEPDNKARQEQVKAIYRFIEDATLEELFRIILEIQTVHNNLIVFDEKNRVLDSIKSICRNGDSIQLNLDNGKN